MTDATDDVFVETRFENVGFNVGDKTGFIFLLGKASEIFVSHNGRFKNRKMLDEVGSQREQNHFSVACYKNTTKNEGSQIYSYTAALEWRAAGEEKMVFSHIENASYFA